MSDRIDNEAGYVLHSRPYKETSLLIEAFTRRHGRISLMARGARRAHSSLKARLLPFQPLSFSWFGKGPLHTLHDVEWQGDGRSLAGAGLMCGFYLNELLMRLLPPGDAHEALYDHYVAALNELMQGADIEPVLRRFELALLTELGYAQTLSHRADGAQIEPDRFYGYTLEVGVVEASNSDNRYSGKTLLDMAAGDYSDPRTLAESKLLMRRLLAHYLGEQPLATRQLLIDLQKI